jgi:hypothetical protein
LEIRTAAFTTSDVGDLNGDGFLAMQTGPGTDYRKIDELHNRDKAWTCSVNGSWIAAYYAKPRRKGWGMAGGWWTAGQADL